MCSMSRGHPDSRNSLKSLARSYVKCFRWEALTPCSIARKIMVIGGTVWESADKVVKALIQDVVVGR